VKILNFGSINIDYVYTLPHIVTPGETLDSMSRDIFAGGKGANQSCALGLAGADVYHAGQIGEDGRWLLELLKGKAVNVDHTLVGDVETGHAVIQVESSGENSIILHGGANREIGVEQIDRVLDAFSEGDILLLQNEINHIPVIMQKASDRGMRIYFNPAPFSPEILTYPLDTVSVFIVNETEAAGLSGTEGMEDVMTSALRKQYPNAGILMTLGASGVRYVDRDVEHRVEGRTVNVIDTTAAGDTFIGFYLACITEGGSIEEALVRAVTASSIAVSRPGAMESIPDKSEVEAEL
jgi:ribokinase